LNKHNSNQLSKYAYFCFIYSITNSSIDNQETKFNQTFNQKRGNYLIYCVNVLYSLMLFDYTYRIEVRWRWADAGDHLFKISNACSPHTNSCRFLLVEGKIICNNLQDTRPDIQTEN